VPSPRAVPATGGEGLFDASELLRDVVDSDPVPEHPPGWTLRDAAAALELAADRDEVLRVLLRYGRDFLEAAALFAVTPDGIVGVDAVGWSGARSRCRAMRLGSQPGGLLGAALTTRGPSLGPVARDPGNERLIVGLGRRWPAVALALPVVVRDRVVCLLYADNGEAPVSARRVGDLLLAAGAVGTALERVVRRTKVAAEQAARSTPDEGGWRVREPPAPIVPAGPATPAEESAPEAFQVIGPRGS
jgi:hypothetical protein